MADNNELPETLEEGAPLREFHLTELLDSASEAAFDRLTGFVCRLLGVPVSLVSVPDDRRQFFMSVRGLGEPWASARETPLSHSFCQHVVTSSEPLVVEDARLHPQFRDNLAIRDLEVVAYLGMPIFTPDGHAVATLCAIDHQPRRWTGDDLATMAQLGEIAMTEIALRVRVKEKDQANAGLLTLNQELDQRVRERTKKIVALAAELTQAEQAERQRIAQHLHDTLQQELFAAQLALHNLGRRAALESDRLRAATEESLNLVTGAIAIVRTATTELSSPTLPDGAFSHTLGHMATLAGERYGLQVAVSLPEAAPEPNEVVCGLLLPLVRELLFNVVKHASVDRATFSVTVLEDEVKITVADDGQGFDAETLGGPQVSSLGLSSVRERVTRLGGRLLVDSEPGCGTRVSLFIPIEFFTLSH